MRRREFLKTVGLGTTLLSPSQLLFADEHSGPRPFDTTVSSQWPVLKYYDAEHLARVAMPLGGIGTGSVSLGGRGDLRDWEVMNRPAKGFTPVGQAGPFFALYLETPTGQRVVRAIERTDRPRWLRGKSREHRAQPWLASFQRVCVCCGLSARPSEVHRSRDPGRCSIGVLQSAHPRRRGWQWMARGGAAIRAAQQGRCCGHGLRLWIDAELHRC